MVVVSALNKASFSEAHTALQRRGEMMRMHLGLESKATDSWRSILNGAWPDVDDAVLRYLSLSHGLEYGSDA